MDGNNSVKLTFLSTVSVVSVLLISIVESEDKFDVYTVPEIYGLIMRILHSITFWSFLLGLLQSLVYIGASLISGRVRIALPLLYAILGIATFVNFLLVDYVAVTFRLKKDPLLTSDQPGGIDVTRYMQMRAVYAYFLPYGFLMTLFILGVAQSTMNDMDIIRAREKIN